MPRPKPLIIRGEVSEPRTGAWCASCALPSAFEFDLLSLSGEGISVVGTFRYCPECGDH